MNKIPVVCIPITKEEAEAQAEANLERICQSDALDEGGREFLRAMRLQIPPRAKMHRLFEAADKISKAILPYSACKSGCSYCCHIATTITSTEAEALGKASGRKPRKLSGKVKAEVSREQWHTTPCPFLKAGRCSVYNDRPMACRLMQNIADSPYFCDTAIPSKESLVTSVNLNQLHAAYAATYMNDTWADIRDFFPPKDKQ